MVHLISKWFHSDSKLLGHLCDRSIQSLNRNSQVGSWNLPTFTITLTTPCNTPTLPNRDCHSTTGSRQINKGDLYHGVIDLIQESERGYIYIYYVDSKITIIFRPSPGSMHLHFLNPSRLVTTELATNIAFYLSRMRTDLTPGRQT